MAQPQIGPDAWLPPVRRGPTAPVAAPVTMPTTTMTLPAETALTGHPQALAERRFMASCAAVARRACSLVVRYRVELAPTGAISTISTLGWLHHLTGTGLGTTLAYSAAGLASAAVAGLGLHLKHEKTLGVGAGLTIAFADVATATAAGLGPASLTVTAITTGLAYTAYVPWLAAHRKDTKQLDKKTTTAKGQVIEGEVIETVEQTALPELPRYHGPFYDQSIPFQPDATRDPAAPIGLGYNELGERVELPVLYRHTLIAGASDWGKSGILNGIIKKLLRRDHVELYGIDLKPGTPELGPWRPLFKQLASTVEEARDLLGFVMAEGKRRGAYLQQLTHAELAAGRPPVRKWVPGEHGTAIYIVTDELGELVRQDIQLRAEEAALRKAARENAEAPEAPITSQFESGLAVLRFLAIQFIAATQQPSAKIFGGNTDARGNYGNRISTRAGEAGHADFVFGRGCRGNGFVPEKLTRPGEFFLQNAESPQVDPPRCRAEWVSDEDIAADVAPYFQGRQAQQPIGRFAPQGTAHLTLLKQPEPPKPLGPPAPVYPDGTTVPRDEWPDLYRTFEQLCVQQGYATKDDLVDHGPFDSRDTVRRALDVWLQHGVQVRKAGRAEQFYLPDTN